MFKKYLKKREENKRIKNKEKVSDIRLKDLIIKCNQHEVVNEALNCILKPDKDGCTKYEVMCMLGEENEILNDKNYLEKIFKKLYVASLNEKFNDDRTLEYCVERPIGGFPFGFNEFMGFRRIDEDLDRLNHFIMIDLHEDDEIFPLEFLVNCKLSKSLIECKYPGNPIVNCLLQVSYMEAMNEEYYSQKYQAKIKLLFDNKNSIREIRKKPILIPNEYCFKNGSHEAVVTVTNLDSNYKYYYTTDNSWPHPSNEKAILLEGTKIKVIPPNTEKSSNVNIRICGYKLY